MAVAEEAKSQSPLMQTASWKSWLEKYGSSSPLLSLRKTRPKAYHISDAMIQSILEGGHELNFKPPLMSAKAPVEKLDLLQFESSRRFELELQARRESVRSELEKTKPSKKNIEGRFRLIREEMQKRISEREKNELQIFFVGETHALDLYFSQFLTPDLSKENPLYRIRKEVAYLSYPVTEDTLFYTQDFYRFVQLLRGAPMPADRFGNQSSVYVGNFAARLLFNRRLRSGMVKLADLTNESLSQVGALVIMDWHYLDGSALFESMPTGFSLRAEGIEKVSVYIESLRRDKTYSLEEFKKTFSVGLDDFLAPEDHEDYKKYRSELFEFLEKGFVSNASLQALHRKLSELETEGLKIKIQGLEEVELW